MRIAFHFGVPRRQLVLPLGLGVVLGCALPTAVVTLNARAFNWSPLVVLHGILLLWCALRITTLVIRGTPRPLALFFWTYVYLWLGLAPFAQLGHATFPLPAEFATSTLTGATILVLVGVVGYEVGHAWNALRRSGPNTMPAAQTLDINWTVVYAITAISLVLTPFLVESFGGLSTFFTSRQAFDVAASRLQANTDSLALLGIYSALLSVPPLIATLGWLHLRRKHENNAARLASIVTLIALLALDVVVNNPISQPRSWFAVCVFSVILATTWAASQRGFRWVAVGLIASIVIAFPYASFFRYTSRGPIPGLRAIVTQYATSGDYDSYQQIAAGIEYVNVSGFDYGEHFLGPALFWVPRRVWHEKPRDSGEVLASFMGYANTNLSAPLWIELYLSGGFPLAFAGFVVLGTAWRRLDDDFARSVPSGGGIIRIVVPLLAVYQLAPLRGSLLTFSGRLALLVVLPLLAAWLASRRPGVSTITLNERDATGETAAR